MKIAKTIIFIPFFIFLSGCDSTPSYSPTSPSTLSITAKAQRKLWLTPNVASADMLDMFTKPELWQEVRSQTRIIKFYQGQVSGNDCPMCGPNVLEKFVSIIPGGAFRWLNDQGIDIAIESGAVKPSNCGHPPDDNIAGTLAAIQSIKTNGGRVSYIAMDEPFASGMPVQKDFARNMGQCNYSIKQTAEYTAYYIRQVEGAAPGVKVGLIEPYAYFSMNQIQSFIEALEAQNVRLPFFHLDFDSAYDINYEQDISGIQSYLHKKGIAFGVIVIGSDGTSSESSFSTGMALAYRINNSAPFSTQDHILVQSWLDYPPSRTFADLRLYPNNLPETSPETLTGFASIILRMF